MHALRLAFQGIYANMVYFYSIMTTGPYFCHICAVETPCCRGEEERRDRSHIQNKDPFLADLAEMIRNVDGTMFTNPR